MCPLKTSVVANEVQVEIYNETVLVTWLRLLVANKSVGRCFFEMLICTFPCEVTCGTVAIQCKACRVTEDLLSPLGAVSEMPTSAVMRPGLSTWSRI